MTQPIRLSSTPNETVVLTAQSFLSLAESHLETPHEALTFFISFLLSPLDHESSFSKPYELLFKLAPSLVNEPDWITHLQPLLNHTPEYRNEQQELALTLARHFTTLVEHKNLRSYATPMHYYAKALMFSNSKETHKAASHLLFNIIRDTFVEELDLLQRRGENKAFEECLKRMDRWNEFGAAPEEQKKLCLQAQQVIQRVPEASRKMFTPYLGLIAKKLTEPLTSPSSYITETYRAKLQTVRTSFSIEEPDTRKLQKLIVQHFIDFFQNTLLQDAFMILGPAPCGYDLRAMGSLGKEEMCPYSDLEYFILIEHEKHRPYFVRLAELLELQIISLGETAPTNVPIFTSLGPFHPSGFHVDSGGNPAQNPDQLILTPQELSTVIGKEGEYLPNTFENTALKTISLATNNPALYKNLFPNTWHKTRALQLLDSRKEDFSSLKTSSSEINIKTHYTSLINYPLSDLALCYALSETNTLDIIDQLVAKKHLSPVSGDLLKEAVEQIYRLRLRLHSHYGQQKEEAALPGVSSHLLPLTTLEKNSLATIDVVVVQPLFKNLPPSSSTINLLQTAFETALKTHDRPALDLIAQAASKRLEITDALLTPTRAGDRIAFHVKARTVQTRLDALLSPTPVDYHFQVQVTTPKATSYLKPSAIQALVGGDGNILRSYKGSAHPVSATGGLHFKQKATHPLMEYAIHNLFFRIAGPLTPATQLIRFDVQLKAGTKTYPVLISETLPGTTLKENWQTLKLTPQGQKAWSWLILCSILTRPGDGLLSNYLAGPNSITCIDNDISFVEPVTKEKVNFCSSLFCLDPLMTLDPDVISTFCHLDVDAILNAWIDDVIAKEHEYLKLFTKVEQERLYTEDPNNQFKATILFREGTLATLNLQFYRLQNTLRNRPQVTAHDLLKELINLRESPAIENGSGTLTHRAYQKSHSLPTIDARLKQITARKTETSLSSMQSDFAALGKVPSWNDIENLAKYSPAKAKKELLLTLLQRSASYITDGVVRGERVLEANFKEITQDGKPDLERQTLVLQALLYLTNTGSQKPVTLKLLNCAALTTTALQPFLHDKLEILDISGSSLLTGLYVPGFLGLLSTPIFLPELKQLTCNNCPTLQTIQLVAPKLEKFEAKKNTNLKTVDLGKLFICDVNLKESSSAKVNVDRYSFGRYEWAKYFGDVGTEPPLPTDINTILQSFCPYWPDKKVHETHLLVLVPDKVNGKSLNLELLGQLIRKPLTGKATKYNYFNLRDHKDTPVKETHWALLTRDVIEGSRSKPYSEQQELIKKPYEAPTVLDVAVAILMEHVRTGIRLYADSPMTYTRCQEKYDKDWQLAVGGFSYGGLCVHNGWDDNDRDGVSALRKFP